MLARGVASWQTEQTLAKSCWPYLPSTFLAWQLMQSPLKTACRSIFAAARPRARSSSLMGLGGGGGRTLMRSMRVLLPRSDETLTDLNNMPLLPARFTLNLIWPLSPAGIVHGTGGSSAVVQPQDGCTLRIVTGTGRELVVATALVVVEMLVTRLIRLPRSRAQKLALVTAVILVRLVDRKSVVYG